ncbi:DUF1642 domain-containing protein [Listeria innocua]|uniref:DUF1642 domain-containing protein n=1 Tax=Listeria innocua TaxID=1642 RepID=UPI0021AD5D3D|nr:DUF1642 domain-containing protein [Listeria innocua]
MRVYHTETQEDFNALMEELEREDCIWRSGDKPTELTNCWSRYGTEMVVYVKNKYLTIGHVESVQGVALIEKYSKSKNSKFPVVPQFVADWYEDNKDDLEYSIWEYIRDWDVQDSESDFYDFMDYKDNHAIETILKMQYGYKVEKEPLYYVQVVNANNGNKCYLNVRSDGNKSLNNSVQNDIFKTQFTEAEIKEMDERYWQFAVPVEEVSK